MIEFGYDPDERACYVTLDSDPSEHGHGVVARTKTVSEDPLITLDYRKDGSLYGVEILLPPKPEKDA